MTSKNKSWLVMMYLFLFVGLYFFMINLPQCTEFIRGLDIFQQDHENFIFIMVAMVTMAYALTELTASSLRIFKKAGWRRPKLGKILVSQGLINQDQLEEALQEQKFKIGEMLVHGGRITPEQRDQAIQQQRKKYRRIGVILRELGYSTEEDIRWALARMKRRLGKILRENRLISDYDLKCALSLRKYRRDVRGRIFR